MKGGRGFRRPQGAPQRAPFPPYADQDGSWSVLPTEQTGRQRLPLVGYGEDMTYDMTGDGCRAAKI